VDSDFVDSWGYSENVQIHHNENQKWYYLENQMPNEIFIFKSADSEEIKEGVFPGKCARILARPLCLTSP
jgi:hypothetical protein